jgi:1D-myo-inositol 3-kinase
VRFVAVGHIVNDITPSHHLGGGVSYSAVAAYRLGHEAHIVTKCPSNHRYLADLNGMGVQVHVLPTALDGITSFANVYEGEQRRQRVTDVQESIALPDSSSLPRDLFAHAVVLVAPVVGEVDINLFPVLARSKSLAVTPQGYFREIGPDGSVTQKHWAGVGTVRGHARAIVLSEEDISTSLENIDQEMLDALVSACPILALTRGGKGSIICEAGEATRVGAFPLTHDEEKDFTGAGDPFAAAFITELAKGRSCKAAAVSAALFAALKIMGVGPGIGMETIPTRDAVTQFVTANPMRMQNFLQRENVAGISLLE